ncbi:MAG: HD domain-containing protein [Haliscomenobacter sp.]|uniref:CCA tRNA nucleotidyltransferase n=1 Tax=Haliscomenobacter sp. TaxID=2717303 RepID=UPI0029AD4148|nr:HD domain-containing protein [Haliscomenobacter sp.]MDX2068136.1 HD domain-containing protein [Haliscomenobacter sp.]
MVFKIQDNERKILEIVSHAAAKMQVPAYVVGGYVRDRLLARASKDIDIVCVGSGIELAERVAGELHPVPRIAIFQRFGTAMIKHRDLEVEFVGARKESYRHDSRKPAVENGSLEDDQNRRDFTINALAVSLNEPDFGNIIDPFDGLGDLERKIIRTPLDPGKTFSDDPLRMMRAIRFATQLDFAIEPATFKAISVYKERIKIISAERIAIELNKIIQAPKPSVGFKLLFDSGLLHIIFPEMTALHGVEIRNGRGHKDNFYHTLQVLDNLSKKTENLWLRWSAILHDIAKPPTKRFHPEQGWTFHGHEILGANMVPNIFRRFRLPMDHKMKYVQKLVRLHLRPISLTKEEITDSAMRRLLVDADEDLEDLMLLCEADITSKNPDKVKRYLENYELVRQRLQVVEERDQLRNWQPPITGEIIMETFGIGPSREVGEIKNYVREAILDGLIPNEFDAAYGLMLEKAGEMGLVKKNN